MSAKKIKLILIILTIKTCSIIVITLVAAQLGTTPMRVPLIMSTTFPDASRMAEAPAKTTNTAYEMADIKRANKVPFGIELAGSLRSPEIFAPACRPVTIE